MSRFPHMSESDFPGIENADASRYLRDSDFDYKKYDKTQMRITVCSVPWDVGLIHVGNAQIGGLGNVVKFESKEARDAWFDSIEDKFTWDTQYREYHTDGFIEIDLPYERCVQYNYAFVEYTTLPVENAEGGKERFHFFIRSCKSLAPSNCQLEILRDTWQDYIYDIDVAYMMLERGHAAIFESDVHEYLDNPIENCEWLLAEDVNFGNSYNTINAGQVVLNSENMKAVIVSSSDWTADVGVPEEEGWNTPNGRALWDGQPAMFAYAVDPARLQWLLDGIEEDAPQLMQSIKGVFFVSGDLLSVSYSFERFGEAIDIVVQQTQLYDLLDLEALQFGYEREYADLAKLYTYPYAYLELCDESGNVSQVKIEETSGSLDLVITSSLCYPWLALDGRVLGIGSDAVRQLEFSNINQHTFEFGGAWYEHINRWEIPCFAVEMSASAAYAYEHYFDLKQRELEISTRYNNALLTNTTNKLNADERTETAKENADEVTYNAKAISDMQADTTYQNANKSADTAKENSDRSAQTAKKNADAAADTAKANSNTSAEAVKENQGNSISRFYDNTYDELLLQTAMKELNNNHIDREWEINRAKLSADAICDINTSQVITEAENEAVSTTTSFNAVTGIIGQAGMGAVTGAAAGTIVPGAGTAAGAIVGAIGGAIGGIVDAGCSGYTANITITTRQDIATITQNQTRIKVQNAATANSSTRDNRKLYNDLAQTLSNDHGLKIAKRNRDTDNAANDKSFEATNTMSAATQTTDKANAQRTYDTQTENAQATRSAESDIAELTLGTAQDVNRANEETGYSVAQRTYDMQIGINERDKTTADSIALANYTTDMLGIDADVNQAALGAVREFGSFSGGETSVTRPMGVFANIVTQSKDAIAMAGDYFLRFGYACNRAYKFEDFNLMPKFTYWKASDMWINGNNVPDAYLDEIRFFLLGGVCVWRNPEDIGRTSIYENR